MVGNVLFFSPFGRGGERRGRGVGAEAVKLLYMIV